MTKPDHPSEEAYASAAAILGCEVAALKAIAQVEAGPMGAFQDDGQPVILFEPHIFDELTKGRYRGRRAAGIDGAPGIISREKWTPGTYGPASIQHHRLAAAAMLDRNAALKSASWGLFQILGRNYSRAGHETIQSFVNAAYDSADAHLLMLVNFIRTDERLLRAIRQKAWSTFARIYNGPSYKVNRYDEKMRAAYLMLA